MVVVDIALVSFSLHRRPVLLAVFSFLYLSWAGSSSEIFVSVAFEFK
jgi:hypothetical protein